MTDWLRYLFLPWSIISQLRKEKAQLLELAALQREAANYNVACLLMACDSEVMVSNEVLGFVADADGLEVVQDETEDGVLLRLEMMSEDIDCGDPDCEECNP